MKTLQQIKALSVQELHDKAKRELLKTNIRRQYKWDDEKFFDIWFNENYPEAEEKPTRPKPISEKRL